VPLTTPAEGIRFVLNASVITLADKETLIAKKFTDAVKNYKV
jgi:hypothetical protein